VHQPVAVLAADDSQRAGCSDTISYALVATWIGSHFDAMMPMLVERKGTTKDAWNVHLTTAGDSKVQAAVLRSIGLLLGCRLTHMLAGVLFGWSFVG